MEVKQSDRPWEALTELVDASDADRVESYLESLPMGEAARAVSRLSDEDRAELLTQLDPEAAAELLEHMPDVQVVEILEQLAPAAAAAIVHEMPSDEQADLLGDLEVAEANAILAAMDPREAEQIRVLVEYPDDVAGGLMVTEFLSYRRDWTVAQVVDDMRSNADRYREYSVQYAYVTTADQHPVGVLSLRDLLLARQTERIENCMIAAPLTVHDNTPLEDLQAFFERHPYVGAPVIDPAGRLLGVVQRRAVDEALSQRSERDYRRAQGIVQEELRTMPVWTRSSRRLAWLSVNIVLNVMAASVIAWYQDTLQQVIALAVFLPIISDMSGCSGNQAVAVSMRELTLGLIKPNELLRVWTKEVAVGAINGCVLGGLIALVAWLWKGNPILGLVVGGALCLNTMVAVSIGGLLPLVLRLLKVDPALASGPVLTTVTDMCGFFLVLSFASALLPQLTGV